ISSTTHADVHLVIGDNVLTCDTQDMNVVINGITVGSFAIAAGVYTLDQSYDFTAIAGPSYTIRYETYVEVEGGCGSATLPYGLGSTITLSGD
ncbi:MAG: hypothetical protein JRF63_15460, partial [Deltaproteobacteria bacterium]|nr:hypothetical protein [Deltaproteobacteria bacterium]